MMTLALLLCANDTLSMSVSSTAFATVRQLVALVMDAAAEALHGMEASASEKPAAIMLMSSAQANLPHCARLLVSDLTLHLRGKAGEWIRGTVFRELVLLH